MPLIQIVAICPTLAFISPFMKTVMSAFLTILDPEQGHFGFGRLSSAPPFSWVANGPRSSTTLMTSTCHCFVRTPNARIAGFIGLSSIGQVIALHCQSPLHTGLRDP